jgi:hypothetical protein
LISVEIENAGPGMAIASSSAAPSRRAPRASTGRERIEQDLGYYSSNSSFGNAKLQRLSRRADGATESALPMAQSLQKLLVEYLKIRTGRPRGEVAPA